MVPYRWFTYKEWRFPVVFFVSLLEGRSPFPFEELEFPCCNPADVPELIEIWGSERRPKSCQMRRWGDLRCTSACTRHETIAKGDHSSKGFLNYICLVCYFPLPFSDPFSGYVVSLVNYFLPLNLGRNSPSSDNPKRRMSFPPSPWPSCTVPPFLAKKFRKFDADASQIAYLDMQNTAAAARHFWDFLGLDDP